MDVKYTTWKERFEFRDGRWSRLRLAFASEENLLWIDVDRRSIDYLDTRSRVASGYDPTLPDDCIPFMTMKKTTIQLSRRHSTIHHLRLSPSSIDGAASKVVLYQKYAVSELRTHSSIGFPSNSGHSAHGSGC